MKETKNTRAEVPAIFWFNYQKGVIFFEKITDMGRFQINYRNRYIVFLKTISYEVCKEEVCFFLKTIDPFRQFI